MKIIWDEQNLARIEFDFMAPAVGGQAAADGARSVRERGPRGPESSQNID